MDSLAVAEYYKPVEATTTLSIPLYGFGGSLSYEVPLPMPDLSIPLYGFLVSPPTSLRTYLTLSIPLYGFLSTISSVQKSGFVFQFHCMDSPQARLEPGFSRAALSIPLYGFRLL